jgi:hypothetical protein
VCSLPSFHTTYVLSVLAPVLLLLLVMGGAVMFKVVGVFGGLSSVKIRTLLDSVLFTLGPLLYIPISKATLVLFDCSKLPDDTIVLDADNGVSCFDGEWWKVFPVALLATIIYVIGVPVYFFTTIWVRKHKLFEPDVTARFGSLYRNFRRDYYWAEVANLSKRLLIVVTALFFSNQQLVQISVFLTIFIASLAVVLKYEPYYVPLYNGVEVRLTVCLLVLLLLGTGSYAERASTASNTFFVVGTVIAIIAICAVALHALVIDILSIRAEKKDEFYSAGERQANLVAHVARELTDVDADPALHMAADEFLATLSNAMRNGRETKARSATSSLDASDSDTFMTVVSVSVATSSSTSSSTYSS